MAFFSFSLFVMFVNKLQELLTASQPFFFFFFPKHNPVCRGVEVSKLSEAAYLASERGQRFA